MPDWEQKLRQHLGGLKLAPAVQEEIIAELAGHLEDAYESFLKQRICAEKSEELAWREVSRGRQLARKIRLAKQGEEPMNKRAMQLWIPGLVTSGLATAFLAILEDEGIRRVVLRTPPVSPAHAYPLWLLSLPVLGFLGAYWSRRVGGEITARITAGIFLSLIYLAIVFLVYSVTLIVDRRIPSLADLAWCLVNWAILPCLALLLGTLPATFIGGERQPRTTA